MKILIITKSRSGYGSHVVLTAIIRQLRKDGHDVKVLVSEHPLEKSRWQNFHLWDDINPEVLNFSDMVVKTPGLVDPYAYTDDVLLHDTRLIETLQAILTNDYDLVLLDSWYLMYSAFLSGIHLRKNVFQLVQSEPVFQPNPNEEWKAAIFKLMPWVPVKRIFISHSLVNKFNAQYGQQHSATGFYLDDAFIQIKHQPRSLSSTKPLRVISMASNFNIRSKGLAELLKLLDVFQKLHPLELTLICSAPFTLPSHSNYRINVINSAIDPKVRAKELIKGDVYITCTINESPGLAQAEALAVGLPCLALDSNGNRDYYNGNNFLMANSFQELTKLLPLILDYGIRKKLSLAAKQSLQNNNIQQCVDRLLAITRKSLFNQSTVIKEVESLSFFQRY